MLEKCPSSEFRFESDWKQIIRVLPVSWGKNPIDEILSRPGDRQEKARLTPEAFGLEPWQEKTNVPKFLAVNPLSNSSNSSDVGWVCLPAGLTKCNEFHKQGIPTNLWWSLKDGNAPLKPVSTNLENK